MINSILSKRFDSLQGCRGVWHLDLRDNENRGYDVHYLPGYVPGFGLSNVSIKQALTYCVENRWKGCRILFSPELLNADCMWPGGYDRPSYQRSNNRVFKEEFATELEFADGDYYGLALDLRFLTPEMIETITSLEDYPIIDDGDCSEIEMEDQHEAWQNWASRDWKGKIESLLENALPDSEERDASEILDFMEDVDSRLEELFYQCMEQTNTYWIEEHQAGWYVDIERVSSAVDNEDLKELTGLSL